MKIDGGFVRGMVDESIDAAAVESVIQFPSRGTDKTKGGCLERHPPFVLSVASPRGVEPLSPP